MAVGVGDRVYEFDSLSALVGAVSDFSASLPPAERIQACQLVTSCCEAILTEAAAEFVAADGDTRAAEAALANDKATKRATRRAAKRAAAAAKNPTITDKMKTGGLSGEQVDAVVRADAKTGGAASTDQSLLDDLATASADETDKIIDDFIVDQADAKTTQEEHDRQRALRDVRKHKTGTGLGAITFEGDTASIDAMHKQLMADANRLYVLDGGRDVTNSAHPRTHGQRLYDALHARISGAGSNSGDTDNDDTATAGTATDSDAGNGDACDLANNRPAPASKPPIQSKRYTPAASRRPTVVITVDAAKLTGADPSLLAEQIGVGPIADSVLAAYLGDTRVGVDLVGLVFAQPGRPLWLGRTVRYASDAQFLALVIRDKGCVDCGAGPEQCHAHHRIPFNAPAQGETNLDDLVLVCGSCHHRLHENNETLYLDRNSGRWKKRPATAAETPPRRPAQTARGPDQRPKPTPTGARPRSNTSPIDLTNEPAGSAEDPAPSEHDHAA